MFKKGDKVQHKHLHPGKEATIIDVIGSTLEVEFEGVHFYWMTSNVDLVYVIDSEKYKGSDWWVDLENGEMFPKVIDNTDCTCSSFALFHYGCDCGAFSKEQDAKEKQRESERAKREAVESNGGCDMDREKRE